MSQADQKQSVAGEVEKFSIWPTVIGFSSVPFFLAVSLYCNHEKTTSVDVPAKPAPAASAPRR